MGFIKTILIIALLYFGFKILLRLLAPWLIRYASKKAEKHFFNTFNAQQNQHPNQERKVGDVSIDSVPEQKTKSDKKVGEYIEFEEIE